MNKNKQIYFIAEIAIFSALGVTLDFVCGVLFGFAWLNGGSISIAMVPIFMMGFRWGIKGGLTTGLIVGTVQLLLPSAFTGGGIIQVFLDYIFAYGVLGIVGLAKVKNLSKKKQIIFASLIMSIAGLLRSAAHIISGVLFFGTGLWGSITYNMLYMAPSIFISIFVVDLLINQSPTLIFLEEN